MAVEKAIEYILRVKDEGTAVLRKLGEEAEQMGKQTQESAKTSTTGFESMTRSIKGYMAAYASVGAAIYFLKSSVSAAMESEMVHAKLARQVEAGGVSWGTYGKTIDSVIQRVSKYAVVQDDVVSNTLSRMVLVTNNVSGSLKNLQLVMDFATARTMDYGTAATIIGRVMKGNTEILGRFWPEMRNLNDVLGKNASLADKTAYALKFAEERVKGMAGEIPESVRQFKEFNLAFADFKKDVGLFVLPGLSDLIKGFHMMGSAAGDAWKALFPQKNPLNEFTDAFRKVNAQILSVQETLEQVGDTAPPEYIKKLGDELNRLWKKREAIRAAEERVDKGLRGQEELKALPSTPIDTKPTEEEIKRQLVLADSAMKERLTFIAKENDFRQQAYETQLEVLNANFTQQLSSEKEFSEQKSYIEMNRLQSTLLYLNQEREEISKGWEARKKLLDESEQTVEQSKNKQEILKLDMEINKVKEEIVRSGMKRDSESFEYEKKLSEQRRAIRESEIANELAMINIKERQRSITHEEAVGEKISLTQQRLNLLGEEYNRLLTISDKESERMEVLKEIVSTQGSLTDLMLEQEELTGEFGAGFDRALKSWAEGVQTTFQIGRDLAGSTAQGMSDSFSNFFFDAMQGKLQTLNDYWMSFAGGIQRLLSDILAQAFIKQILTWAGLLNTAKNTDIANTTALVGANATLTATLGVETGVVYGLAAAYAALAIAKAAAGAGGASTVGMDMGMGAFGPGFHSGGPITADLPRYHNGGISPDERIIVAQTGERILSREQNQVFEKMAASLSGGSPGGGATVIMNIQATDAASFAKYMNKNSNVIGATLAKMISNNHPIRRR